MTTFSEVIEWTPSDNLNAQAQGWLITYAYMQDYEGVQLERFDEAAIFDGDYEAVAFVADRAMRGDSLATKAIAYVKQEGGRLHR